MENTISLELENHIESLKIRARGQIKKTPVKYDYVLWTLPFNHLYSLLIT